MKTLWCWRCKMEVGMLEGDEAKHAHQLFGEAMRGRSGNTIEERFKPLFDYYKEVTGEEDTNPNSIIHHMVDLYGPPCEACGKPYRTKQASFCAACGNERSV